MAINKKAAPKPAMKPAMSTDRKSYQVSENVTVKAKKGTPGLSSSSLNGASQAVRQNANAATPTSKSESKANARGLKAANSDSQFKVNKPMTRLLGGSMQVGKTVQAVRGSKKEARLKKGQEWADSHSKKSSAKYAASMQKEKARREAGK